MVIRTVPASRASTFAILRVKRVKAVGLFGTLATRSKVNTTSSAVSGVPSENRTPGRSVKSHSVGLAIDQRSASRGWTAPVASCLVSASKMESDTCMFGDST